MVPFPAFEKKEKGAVIWLGIRLGIYAVMLISLFTVDSILFKMAKWKVYCSPDIHGSISRIQDLGIHGNVTCVSMGNPHCVTFGTDSSKNLFDSSLQTTLNACLGAWDKCKCNAGLRYKACVVVLAAVLEGRANRICIVDFPGEPLEIEWREANNHVYLTGPTELVFYESVPL